MLVCGDPAAAETCFGGYDKAGVSPASCPDNVAFDTTGNLWISTDGNALGSNGGIFRVPTKGPERGRVQQFVTMPRGADACGPLIADQDRSLFFAVQHPGEIDGATFEDRASTWPHSDDFPRPSVCVAFRQAGPRQAGRRGRPGDLAAETRTTRRGTPACRAGFGCQQPNPAGVSLARRWL